MKTFERLLADAEETKKLEENTLEEAISNALLDQLPRISPHVFEEMRQVNVSLTEEQKDALGIHYFVQVRGFTKANAQRGIEEGWRNHPDMQLVSARIPLVSLAKIPEDQVLEYEHAGQASYIQKMSWSTNESQLRVETLSHFWQWATNKETKNGKTAFNLTATWIAPFSLDVCVAVPELPRNMARLGDAALLRYYKKAERLDRKCKERSQERPYLAIAWSPIEESLYCTGTIPEPTERPRPDPDPALLLVIPNREKTIYHGIGVWRMDDENSHVLLNYFERTKRGK